MQYWKNALNFEFDGSAWQTVYKLCFKTIKDNSLICFQYRIIYKFLGTQSYLYKVKLAENSSCRLCSQNDETILHLFTSCSKVLSFWTSIKIWLERKLNLHFDTNPIKILFGDIFLYKTFSPINLIYMSAKQFIFHCAKSGKKLNILEYQALLFSKYTEQNHLSHIEMRQNQFEKQWLPFIDLFFQVHPLVIAFQKNLVTAEGCHIANTFHISTSRAD